MNIEVQGGLVLGSYYGFDEDGDPVWYTFSGRPEASDEERPWAKKLETTLLRYEGGACPDCDYVEPEASPEGSISISFLRRNYAEVRISESVPQSFVPLLAGAALVEDTADITEYTVPDVGDNGHIDSTFNGSPWVFVFRREDQEEAWSRTPALFLISPFRVLRTSEGEFRSLGSVLFYLPFVPDSSVVGSLVCERVVPNALDDGTGAAGMDCKLSVLASFLRIEPQEYLEFSVSLADIGDSRIEGSLPERGLSFKAYRVDYD